VKVCLFDKKEETSEKREEETVTNLYGPLSSLYKRGYLF